MNGRLLPSWNEGRARTAILRFLARVTTQGTSDFVPPADRIAVFDNDGTLWCEQPVPVQAFFLFDRIRELATQDTSLYQQQPFKAFLEHDDAGIASLGKRGISEVFFATHAGMSEEEFERAASRWFERARHPKFGRRFLECVYLPQLELLELLREHEFRTFIVTCSGIDFVRTFAEGTYGIARERVVGSSVKLHFELRPGRALLWKSNSLNSFDDREAKPENIGLHIGRRPLFAFGNSDGDLAMMLYSRNGPGPRLALLLHHDDADREFAYDRNFRVSPLADALDRAEELGVTVVSMKQDWKQVFR